MEHFCCCWKTQYCWNWSVSSQDVAFCRAMNEKKQQNPNTKTLTKLNKTSKPQIQRVPCSANSSEETLQVSVPVARRNPAQQRPQCPGEHVPLFVNKLNELLSRYISSSVWAEGTRIWAYERLDCNGYTLPLLSLRHGKGQLLSSKMCHCYKYDCIIYCKLFSKFIANY